MLKWRMRKDGRSNMFADYLTVFKAATILAVSVLFITMVVEDRPRFFRIFTILSLGFYCVALAMVAFYGFESKVRHPLEQQLTVYSVLVLATFGFIVTLLREVSSSKKSAEMVKVEK